jgi:hypothetical protein
MLKFGYRFLTEISYGSGLILGRGMRTVYIYCGHLDENDALQIIFLVFDEPIAIQLLNQYSKSASDGRYNLFGQEEYYGHKKIRDSSNGLSLKERKRWKE